MIPMPYRAEYGAIYHQSETGFLFTVSPPERAVTVAEALNDGEKAMAARASGIKARSLLRRLREKVGEWEKNIGAQPEGTAALCEEIDALLAPAPKYTAEWVEQQAEGKTRLDHHRCGGCNVMVAYRFRDGQVAFDPSCGCGGGSSSMRPSSWQEIADWLAMQKDDGTRDSIMEGLR